MGITQLDAFQSDAWLKLETRGVGTYIQIGEIMAGALLSSIFIESMDSGATLKVNYFDATTGAAVGERFELKGHDLLSAPGSDRIMVTRHHNRVGCEAIVTGGNIKFSVYGTALPAADISEAMSINSDGETVIRTSATGVFSPTGLRLGGRMSAVILNSSTWTALPPIPLANRNAINIQNYSGSNIKLNFDNTVSGYEGIQMNDQVERNYDIKDTILIFAKSEVSGAEIWVEEIS
jgi:hypothetical protein